MNIRECNKSDIATLTQFTLSLHHHENDHQLKPHSDLEINLTRWLNSELDSPNSLLLLAESEGKPAGFICATSVINDNGFLADPIKGLIQLLWVEPAYRRMKLAQKMVTTLEQCFIELGIPYVECNYLKGNSLAESFWQKQNYHVTSVTSRKWLNTNN